MLQPDSPVIIDFKAISSAFIASTEHNHHLLSYLTSKHLINSLLNPLQSVSWLLHPQRLQFMALLEKEIDNFMKDIEYMNDKYQQFTNNIITYSKEKYPIVLQNIQYYVEKSANVNIEKNTLKETIDFKFSLLKTALTGTSNFSLYDWQKTCQEINESLNILGPKHDYKIQKKTNLLY
ncbi:MAG: hypothetical protein HAW62_00500 [Endozoicomonadaceae bacterium]|nr:hypothetical protein [Endozoicomonadaceae bacterium]